MATTLSEIIASNDGTSDGVNRRMRRRWIMHVSPGGDTLPDKSEIRNAPTDFGLPDYRAKHPDEAAWLDSYRIANVSEFVRNAYQIEASYSSNRSFRLPEPTEDPIEERFVDYSTDEVVYAIPTMELQYSRSIVHRIAGVAEAVDHWIWKPAERQFTASAVRTRLQYRRQGVAITQAQRIDIRRQANRIHKLTLDLEDQFFRFEARWSQRSSTGLFDIEYIWTQDPGIDVVRLPSGLPTVGDPPFVSIAVPQQDYTWPEPSEPSSRVWAVPPFHTVIPPAEYSQDFPVPLPLFVRSIPYEEDLNGWQDLPGL